MRRVPRHRIRVHRKGRLCPALPECLLQLVGLESKELLMAQPTAATSFIPLLLSTSSIFEDISESCSLE
jgi:hypothetical protein